MLNLAKAKYIPLQERMKNTIETGFIDYDRHVYDLKPGEITILFGRNGEGKSTVASQILAHHINVGKKAYLYSGELSENKIQEWLYKQVIGSNASYYDIVNTKYGRRLEIKPKVIQALKQWHDDRLYIYNMKIDKVCKDTKKLFMDMETAKVCGADLFLIDNLMTAFEINERTQYSDQANFVQDCKDFARDNNVHIIIVAHPNKDKGELPLDAYAGNLTKNDVSGSGNISNKADNIISVERMWKIKGQEYDSVIPDAFISSLKDREEGMRGVFPYWFSRKALRFYNTTTQKEVMYDWEKFYVDAGVQEDLPF